MGFSQHVDQKVFTFDSGFAKLLAFLVVYLGCSCVSFMANNWSDCSFRMECCDPILCSEASEALDVAGM